MRVIALQDYNAAQSCNLLEICDMQLLLECPIDLSPLSFFLPTLESKSTGKKKRRRNIEESSGSLLNAEPWYKTIDMSLFDAALINAVVVSNPESILGLPFLTRHPEFTAKVFATEATATIGRLMMQELVSNHSEYLKLYGDQSLSKPPEELAKHYILQKHNPNWHNLYSAEDIRTCMEKIQTLRYGEQASIDGYIVLTPYSSGQSIGASNWIIKGPYSSLAYISSHGPFSSSCTSQDTSAFEGNQVLLLAGSKIEANKPVNQTINELKFANRPWATAGVKFFTPYNRPQTVQNSYNNLESNGTSSHIGKAVVEAVSRKGSVLLPVNVSDKVLELIEVISTELASANMGHVPMFYVSPSAQEFLAYANTIPEWLSSSRQEKLYAGDPLFGHVELLKAKRLHYLRNVSSPEMTEVWIEPCVVLAAHASLRMGPAVQLLHRWRHSSECLLLLITQPGVDVEQVLQPFNPMSMQVRHLLSSAPSSRSAASLLEIFQAKVALVPEALRADISTERKALFYSHTVPLEYSDSEEDVTMELSADLAARIKPKQLKSSNLAIARLSAEMYFHQGNFLLEMPRISKISNSKQTYCGKLEVDVLLKALRDKGLVDAQVHEQNTITLSYPSNATIELANNRTIIKTNDPVSRRLIADAVTSTLQSV